MQKLFNKIGVNYQVQESGNALVNLILVGAPKIKNDEIDAIMMLDYYNGVALRAKELIGFDWIPELKPLADLIEKHAERLINVMSEATPAESATLLNALTSDLEATLTDLSGCIEAYIDPFAIMIDRGHGLMPKATAVEAYRRRDSAREFVQAARQRIEERLNDLGETLGLVLEAWHWEKQYEGYFDRPIRKRAKQPPSFYPRIGDLETKLEIISGAGRYLDLTWMHCRSATDLLLLALIDTEFIPIDRKVETLRRFIVVDTVPRVAYLAIVACWIAYAFAIGRRFEWVGMAAALWLLIGPVFVRKWEARAANLRTIRSEINNKAYDADAIAARLKSAERSGVVVPTIAYGLLKLRAQQQSI